MGDVARLAISKQAIFLRVLSRTLFGSNAVDTSVAPFRNSTILAEADRH